MPKQGESDRENCETICTLLCAHLSAYIQRHLPQKVSNTWVVFDKIKSIKSNEERPEKSSVE